MIREKSHDFRVGGRAMQDGHWQDGPRSRFESAGLLDQLGGFLADRIS